MRNLNRCLTLAVELFAAALLLATAGSALADVRYVDVNSTNATPPYTNWTTAATNIQDAVVVAVAGDEIVVTNGIYAPVGVGKPLALRSINGPQSTTIDGGHSGGCVYLTSGASLSGFTLTNGLIAAGNGAGVWCESQTAVVSNCVIVGNRAFNYGIREPYGGGAYGGTLNNCTLTGNSARKVGCDACDWPPGGGAYRCTLNNCTLTGNFAEYGGGAYGCTLNNCTLTGNSAGCGGGAYRCALNNCTLTGNSAGSGGGAWGGTLNNCTLTGNSAYYGGGADASTLNNCIVYFNNSAFGEKNHYSCTLNYSCTTPLPTNGVGNISVDPQLASFSHLSAGSPCRGAGNAAYASGTDIDGEAWLSPPSIGCDEYHAGAVTGPLNVGITASFTNVLIGFTVQLTALIEGRAAANSWDFGDGTAATNQPYTSHAWTTLGDYAVVLRAYNESHPGGISATVTVHVVAGVHYVAADGTNPVAPYTSWGTAATNILDAINVAEPGAQVLVTNGTYASVWAYTHATLLGVRSINGPQFTLINGGKSNLCVILAESTSLSGFTLTNGVGGALGGTLSNCTLTGNSAGCFCDTYGGGAAGCTLNNCTLTGNSASYGGGAYGSTLNNCTLTGNSAAYGGAGAWGSTLNNCTLTGNSGANYGGGAADCTLNNCVVYFNTSTNGANYDSSCTLNYSCTTPMPTNGVGNITNAPLFVDQASGNLRLQSNSPCINAGLNAFAPAGPDLDGNPRIVGGTVDMGAYEFQSLDLISFGVVSNQFGFNITGQSNWVIVLEASSDFTNWTPLTTNTLGVSPFPFRDSTPPNLPRRFYRARMQ